MTSEANKGASSQVLLGLCDRLASYKGHAELVTLQEYLEARLLLLKHIPVCSITVVCLCPNPLY